MKKFVIYTNPYKDVDEAVTGRVKNYLISHGCEICDNGTADAMTLVLGGDGTMLQAIREISSDGPFIGINLGNLGFLTEIEKDNIEPSLEQIINGDYVIEKRMLLEGRVIAGAAKHTDAAAIAGVGNPKATSIAGAEPDAAVIADRGADNEAAKGECDSDEAADRGKGIWALNDVILTRCGRLKILRFEIYVNGRLLHEYLADGIIVSTPTGSTGYNLSAGGPLASPASEVIMLTPISPHSLNQRSIILSGEDVVEIRIPMSKDNHIQEMEVSFDGNNGQTVHTGDSILVSRSSRYISIARLGKDSFLDVLNRKMSEK